jgi:TIR domain
LARIFISYSRPQSGYARRLRDSLVEHFGERAVAASDPSAGEAQIQESVTSCDSFVLLVPPSWLAPAGSGRMRSPNHLTRLELTTALDQGLLIVPVFVGGASMPATARLPFDLEPIAHLHWLKITDRRWATDVKLLIEALESRKMAPKPTPRRTHTGVGNDRPRLSVGSLSEDPLITRLARSARRGALPGAVLAVPRGVVALGHDSRPPRNGTEAERSARRDREVLAERALGGSRNVLLLAGAGIAALAALIAWLAGCAVDIPPDEDEPDEADTVDCTVFAPPSARRGEQLLVQVFAHLPPDAEIARALATEFDAAAKRRAVKSLELSIPRGSILGFELDMPGATVDRAVETLRWDGRAQSVQFRVSLPSGIEAPVLIGTVTVSLASVPVGHVKFKVEVGDDPAAPAETVGADARRYRSAFISYASKDRNEALRGAQMLRAVEIECFQDVLDLEPGERWEQQLYSRIADDDLFILFWSKAAHDSEWVRKEALYALDCHQSELDPPAIKPIILERPPISPWPELAHLHFNDRAVYFMTE